MECFKKLCGILFGCEINVLFYHKKLVYAATKSEYQRLMHWQLILKESGTNIQHIDRVENIVSDNISRLTSTTIDQYETSTSRTLCLANKLFTARAEKSLIMDTL